MNRPVTSKEIESVIKNLPANKSPGPDSFIGEFYRTLKELITAHLKLFQKIEEKRTLPISCYHYPGAEARGIVTGKLQTNMLDEQ